ncbi:helix-turn-helix transcriptional regulator [Rhodococcoides yunnanense]|jgi:transcriptional regulator with XRE-family HTH domain|uniref:helix-turn-helix transcriptional regulator n=1 Tax=Rhodococcoides yunnanense TaxID=278209 RepID=UPI0022B18E9C|nr:helix-turn-helix transcriptional regulator [Rhodococcus yunnanensis]MCZ4275133.1 helix-turn-helix transcriptional regulator [Rhodococcus yunnanensis]
MAGHGLVERARRAAGLTQGELARRAHTSRPTLSAYENGRKSPSLETLERLLGEAGFDVEAVPRVEFVDVPGTRGRVYRVPTSLPRLPVAEALATVVLPLDLNWSSPGREFRLADRVERARLYENVLREGRPEDVLRYIDGVLLVDVWTELVLPRDVRTAWEFVVDALPRRS